MGYELSEKDKNDPMNRKMQGGDTSPIKDKRSCTDVFCMLMLISAWVVMTALGFVGLGMIESTDLPKGNPYRLTNSLDMTGQLCGFSETDATTARNVAEKAKGYYLPSGGVVCVSECPTVSDFTRFHCEYSIQDTLNDMWQEEWAPIGVTPEGETAPTPSDPQAYAAYLTAGYSAVQMMQCMPWLASYDQMNYCIPVDMVNIMEAAGEAGVDSGVTVEGDGPTTAEPKEISAFEKLMSDIFVGAPYIFGFGFGMALVVGFGYLFILKIPGILATVIWSLIMACNLIIFLMGAMLYVRAASWKTAEQMDEISPDDDPEYYDYAVKDPYEIQVMTYAGYFFFGLAALWFFFFVICMRARIMLAIGIVQQAGTAIGAMPMLTIFPCFQVAAVAIFMVPWTIYSLFLASGGELVVYSYEPYPGAAPVQYKEWVYTKNQKYAGLYMLFIYYWTTEFVIAIGNLIVAMAVAFWYFTLERDTIGNSTVFKSIRWSFWYHMGTAAFGSLIIAIIKTIRAVIAYLQKQASKGNNFLLKAVLCCIQCCMWCVEKCMKFLNKNAYIQTAIKGYSFCKAAKCAFFLIARNILRIAAVSMVASFVLLVGKVLIPVATTFIAYMALMNMDTELYGLWGPLMLTFLLAWFTTEMFNSVFDMAIWTVLQCYVADEEMNGKAKYFSKDGRDSLGDELQKAADGESAIRDDEAKKGGWCSKKSAPVAAEA